MLIVKFQDGAIYHIFDDRFVDQPKVSKRKVARLSTIEWCNLKQGFEVRWHPILLQWIDGLSALCNDTYKTREAALQAENDSVNLLMQLPGSTLTFDLVLANDVSLDQFRCRE
jgi:hypothetical protein